jgi:MFS transporter, PAT family, beta-lactamase induction signal transducer AmpG
MASPYSAVFRDRNLAVILLLGFSSGLPLALTGGTLQAWMTIEGIDLKTIGIFTLVGLPYTWKFLWAPFMDRYVPPFLGRRRGWLVITQLALVGGLIAMGVLSPKDDAVLLAAVAVFVAFASASQDIVFDAYRTDITAPASRGPAAALTVLGYRVALLVAGALALVIAGGTVTSGWLGGLPGIGFGATYFVMAALMAFGIATTLWGKEPLAPPTVPRTLDEAVGKPFREFFSRKGAVAILLLIILYKLGDAFAGSLTTAFLLRGPGFSLEEVGIVNKGAGLAATIVGVLFGGALMVRLGLYRSLLVFGVLQAVSNLAFMWLAAAGKSYVLLVFAVCFENVTGGMGTAAFVALLMALCDARFTATQYALLSALASFGRVYVGPAAGYLTDPKQAGLAWTTFFFWTFVSALPGLAMLWWKRAEIRALDMPKEAHAGE